MTREQIQKIIDQVPTLNSFGIGVSDLIRDERERLDTLESGKRSLLDSAEACTKCCEWLQNVEKTKAINDHANSYGLKHVAEVDIGYITNGSFIAAAIHSGFEYNVTPGSPNVTFNMSTGSINDIKRRQKAEGKTNWVI